VLERAHAYTAGRLPVEPRDEHDVVAAGQRGQLRLEVLE
jgi:hypothetical protein